MQIISKEQRLVLLLSKPFFSRADQKILESLVESRASLNMERVYRLCLDNEIAGFAYKYSKGIDLFPQADQKHLDGFYKNTAICNMLALKETLRILEILSRQDITAIPLKGTWASDTVFEDFGVYPSKDIDILVQPQDLFKAKKVLCNEYGYSNLEGISESDLLQNHYHLILVKEKALEIHWNLVKRYFKIPVGFWWKTAKPFEWNGIKCMELSIENNILYHVFRLFDHCFYPLRFFTLLGGIIDRHRDDIDWDQLIQTADDHGMKRLLAFTLKATSDLLGTYIPKVVMEQTMPVYPLFRRLVFSGIFSGISRKHLRMMLYTLLLIKSENILKILVDRLFPSPGELRLRYGIPPESQKVYLYYLLNPVLLIFQTTKKKTNA